MLKRRNVGRVAILYVIVCYLILEPFGLFVHVLRCRNGLAVPW